MWGSEDGRCLVRKAPWAVLESQGRMVGCTGVPMSQAAFFVWHREHCHRPSRLQPLAAVLQITWLTWWRFSTSGALLEARLSTPCSPPPCPPGEVLAQPVLSHPAQHTAHEAAQAQWEWLPLPSV